MATAPDTEAVHDSDERTRPPFLRRVCIRGYKSIAYCDVRLQPLTILVGRNASGKSNFLDALAFLRDSMETSVTEAVKRRGGWSSIACRTSDTKKITFEIEAAFTCGRPYRRVNGSGVSAVAPSKTEEIDDIEGSPFVARYRLELPAEPASTPASARESLEVKDQAKAVKAGFEVERGVITRWRGRSDSGAVIDLPHPRDLFSVYRPDRPLLSVIGTQPFIDLGEGLRTMGFYNFHPDAIRLPQQPNPGWLLEKDGRNLASVIEGLNEIDPESVERVRDYLTNIAEEVRGFRVVRHADYETIRFQMQSGSAERPLEFDAASMSDGTLRALAALMAAFQAHLPIGPTVIGIEEPEAALHPAATRALVDALEEATQSTQILLTTHSADLLADPDIDPSQVLIVRNRNGQTHITPVDPASREIIRKELYTLADLQRMDQLDLDEADLQRQSQASHTNDEE